MSKIDMQKCKLVITGHGHSGTTWLTEVLKACGVNAAHEGIFQNDVQEVEERQGDYEAEVSCKAAPRLGQLPDDVQVIYVIRHPLDVIRSMYYSPNEHGWAYATRTWVNQQLGDILPTQDPFDYICRFYVAWHQLILSSYRVDATIPLEACPGRLLHYLGLSQKVKKMPDREGERAPKDAPEVKWSDIPRSSTKRALWSIADTYFPERARDFDKKWDKDVEK